MNARLDGPRPATTRRTRVWVLAPALWLLLLAGCNSLAAAEPTAAHLADELTAQLAEFARTLLAAWLL